MDGRSVSGRHDERPGTRSVTLPLRPPRGIEAGSVSAYRSLRLGRESPLDRSPSRERRLLDPRSHARDHDLMPRPAQPMVALTKSDPARVSQRAGVVESGHGSDPPSPRTTATSSTQRSGTASVRARASSRSSAGHVRVVVPREASAMAEMATPRTAADSVVTPPSLGPAGGARSPGAMRSSSPSSAAWASNRPSTDAGARRVGLVAPTTSSMEAFDLRWDESRVGALRVNRMIESGVVSGSSALLAGRVEAPNHSGVVLGLGQVGPGRRAAHRARAQGRARLRSGPCPPRPAAPPPPACASRTRMARCV